MIDENEPKFVLRVTHQTNADGDLQEYVRPKYWTGRMNERWPELLSDKAKAHVFSGKRVAQEVLAGFGSRGFVGELEPA